MKLKRPEIVIISMTLAFACFTAGYFMGRSGADKVITVASVSSPALSASSTQPSVPPALPPAAEATAAPPSAAPGKININTAGEGELASLPGIGSALAGRILEYREKNGGFKSVDEITEVPGIGEVKYAQLKELITIG